MKKKRNKKRTNIQTRQKTRQCYALSIFSIYQDTIKVVKASKRTRAQGRGGFEKMVVSS